LERENFPGLKSHFFSEIYESPTWMKLRDHADEIKALHLRDLIQDPARCEALTAEFSGIVLDYSRQNVTTATMVSTIALLI
jgi:glucose-6-phosphate isomerase